jgi:hypothetical protein
LVAASQDHEQTSTLTITTSASGTVTIGQASTPRSITWAGLFGLPGLMLIGFMTRRRRLVRRIYGLTLMMLMGVALATGLSGCGSGIHITPTPLGTSVVTVMATANATGTTTNQTTQFTLIVTK